MNLAKEINKRIKMIQRLEEKIRQLKREIGEITDKALKGEC